MFKKILKISLLSLLLVIPVLVFAQVPVGGPNTPTDFKAIICNIAKLALDFIPYIIIIAAGAFLTGLIKYVANGDNEEKRTEGIKMMVYGILGFFFMVSIWGILKLFTESFNLRVGIPQFKQQGSGAGCPGVSNKAI